MKRLIVNADDFGISESINEGIVDSHTHGIVTATTWVANGNTSMEAANLAPETLDVGLHLALQDVQPLSEPRSFNGLLTSKGHLPAGHWPVVSWIMRKQGSRTVIRREWLAQLARFETIFGRWPTHIDSHKHIGLFPPLQDLILEIAMHAGNAHVRTPVDVSYLPSSLVFSTFGKRLKKKTKTMNLPGTDAFLGYQNTGHMTQPHLDMALHRVQEGVTELMVHPGSHNEPAGYQRKAERTALTSQETRRLVDSLGILLVSPSDVI